MVDCEAPLLVEALEFDDELLYLVEVLALEHEIVSVGQEAIVGRRLPE